MASELRRPKGAALAALVNLGLDFEQDKVIPAPEIHSKRRMPSEGGLSPECGILGLRPKAFKSPRGSAGGGRCPKRPGLVPMAAAALCRADMGTSPGAREGGGVGDSEKN